MTVHILFGWYHCARRLKSLKAREIVSEGRSVTESRNPKKSECSLMQEQVGSWCSEIESLENVTDSYLAGNTTLFRTWNSDRLIAADLR